MVEKTIDDLGFMQAADKPGSRILMIAERGVLLSRIADVVAYLAERYGCEVYLMCGDYEFNEWLKADFPE